MIVFLFRHGTVEGAGQKIFLGKTDLALSDEGRNQAVSWRTYFTGTPLGRMMSSPMSRALEFARIITENSAEPVEVCSAFSEIDLGQWDGRPMKEIQHCEKPSWDARGKDIAGFRPPGGESFADLQKRVIPAFERLTGETAANVLLVSHAGVNRVLLCHLMGLSLSGLFGIRQAPGCMNIIEGKPGQWRVSGLNIKPPKFFGNCRKATLFLPG